MAEEPTGLALQRAIEQVKGVLSARPVFDETGQLQEVHVLAKRSRNARQIVQDVEALCSAQFGMPVDRRRISVAQIDSTESEDEPSIIRVYPRAVQVNNTGSEVEVKVELISDTGATYTGVASGAQSAANRLRLVAMATLFAVEEYLNDLCHFVLDDVVSFDIGQFTGVLVGITLVTSGGEEELIGSSLVKRDVGEAVVKAVLSGINRRLLLITSSEAS
ncbi:MAG: hypothetical protein QME79_00795 [Bacillota bacterium]|nr:hypothetical protein [Bacillota bacterium]